MNKGKAFTLFVVLKAVDKATAPLRALGKTISTEVTPAYTKLREINNKARLAAEASGLNKITGAAKNLGSAVAGAAGKLLILEGALAAVVGISGGFLYKITKQTAAYGDLALKTSQKIGVEVETWQELAYASKASGVEQNVLSNALIKLNQNITAAASGNKNLIAWFKRAGIEIKGTNGKIKTADAILMELADIFNRVPDGAKKTAVAMALVGRAGADLIPMLNAGNKGISAMRQEARDFNFVLKREVAQGAADFLDNISRITASLRGMVYYLGSLLIPIFDDVVISLQKWIAENRELIQSKLQAWVNNLKDTLPLLKKHFFGVIEAIKEFSIKISGALKYVGGFKGVLTILAVYLAGSFVASLVAVAQAFIALGVAIATTPLGWIMAAIAAIAVGAILIYKNWEKMGPLFKKLIYHLLGGPIMWLVKIMSSLLDIDLFEAGKNIFNSLWAGMKSIFEKIKQWFGNIKNIIPSFLLPGNNKIEINSKTGGSTSPRVVPASGEIQKNQMITQKSAAEVKVEFANAPKGTTVKTQKNNGVDMDLNMGYAMATH